MTDLKMGADETDFLSPLNGMVYIINQEIKKINTADLVKVVSVNGDTIDVIPIIKNVNASKEPIEESVIYGVRYIQWQYGSNAIVCAPAVGDIGLLVCCKRDISNIESGIVGSLRRYSLADGIYIGGIMGLNATPTQYVSFSNNNLTIKGTGTINVEGSTVNVNASTVNLGGSGGTGVATVGKRVTTDGTPTGSTVGFIAEGSTVVKST